MKKQSTKRKKAMEAGQTISAEVIHLCDTCELDPETCKSEIFRYLSDKYPAALGTENGSKIIECAMHKVAIPESAAATAAPEQTAPERNIEELAAQKDYTPHSPVPPVPPATSEQTAPKKTVEEPGAQKNETQEPPVPPAATEKTAYEFEFEKYQHDVLKGATPIKALGTTEAEALEAAVKAITAELGEDETFRYTGKFKKLQG
jgi:hypothetical protein